MIVELFLRQSVWNLDHGLRQGSGLTAERDGLDHLLVEFFV
jgi:hypothetical protein